MKTEQASALARYGDLLGDIKGRIRAAQNRAVQAVNAELVRLYWDIGRLIGQRQQQAGWGTGVIPKLARDLHNELPELKGFSERNLKLMVQFAGEYPGLFIIGQPPVAQFETSRIPWAHNVQLIQKIKNQPTIGLILCQTKDRILAEYTLRGINKPIGVADYEIGRALPMTLASSLPSVEMIEAEMHAELAPPAGGSAGASGGTGVGQ